VAPFWLPKETAAHGIALLPLGVRVIPWQQALGGAAASAGGPPPPVVEAPLSSAEQVVVEDFARNLKYYNLNLNAKEMARVFWGDVQSFARLLKSEEVVVDRVIQPELSNNAQRAAIQRAKDEFNILDQLPPLPPPAPTVVDSPVYEVPSAASAAAAPIPYEDAPTDVNVLCTCEFTSMSIHIYVYPHEYIYIHVFVKLFVYIYIYIIYIYMNMKRWCEFTCIYVCSLGLLSRPRSLLSKTC